MWRDQEFSKSIIDYFCSTWNWLLFPVRQPYESCLTSFLNINHFRYPNIKDSGYKIAACHLSLADER